MFILHSASHGSDEYKTNDAFPCWHNCGGWHNQVPNSAQTCKI
ncbi:MAG: hypothetical protein RID53_34660 [Coleofasciculus sp. B1-GNL1-01]